jgi:hypothetical protein
MSNRTVAPLTIAQGSRLLRESYRLVAAHRYALLRLALPWLLFRLAVVPFGDLSWVSVRDVVHFMGWSVISVSWYRLILLSIPAPIAGHFEWREMRYIFANLVALVPFHAISLLIVALSTIGAQDFGLRFVEMLDDPRSTLILSEVASVAYLLVLARFQLLFPAIALDATRNAVRRSLKLTRGSSPAIFLWSVVSQAHARKLTGDLPVVRRRGCAGLHSFALRAIPGPVSGAKLGSRAFRQLRFCGRTARRDRAGHLPSPAVPALHWQPCVDLRVRGNGPGDRESSISPRSRDDAWATWQLNISVFRLVSRLPDGLEPAIVGARTRL